VATLTSGAPNRGSRTRILQPEFGSNYRGLLGCKPENRAKTPCVDGPRSTSFLRYIWALGGQNLEFFSQSLNPVNYIESLRKSG